ncbi:hypothetical protein FIBSPDRAFT_890402 [Athelia psychrophila]|uniref:Uncharacterized protein n=1 Tax=Athelia psychrophila TaxID=1759441 RepID=A0A166L328_9AGAM|nr:hypothetical protein FIBSPDRAFT_890402 [Fibularhizoctonia sp. CBS 109695]
MVAFDRLLTRNEELLTENVQLKLEKKEGRAREKRLQEELDDTREQLRARSSPYTAPPYRSRSRSRPHSPDFQHVPSPPIPLPGMSAPRSCLLQRSLQTNHEHNPDLSSRLTTSTSGPGTAPTRLNHLEYRGENCPRDITTPALHGNWSGVTIDTITDCDRLFAAAQQDDQAFLYVDYCNSVSQIIQVHLRSAGIAELLRRWGVFHQCHGDRRDRLCRENGVPVCLAKKRKVATQDKPSEDPIGYQDKDAPPHNDDAVMHYDEEVVLVPQYEAPVSIPAPEVPVQPSSTINGAPVYPGVAKPLLIPVVQPWSNWSDPEVIPVNVTNHRLRMDQAPSDIITKGSYPDVADWVLGLVSTTSPLGPLGDRALKHFPFECNFVTGLIVHGWLRDHGVDDGSASALAIQGFARESLPIEGALVNRDSVPSYDEYTCRWDLPGWNLTTNSAARFQYPLMMNHSTIEDTLAERRTNGTLGPLTPWPDAAVHHAGATPPPTLGRSEPTPSSSAKYHTAADDTVSLGSPSVS